MVRYVVPPRGSACFTLHRRNRRRGEFASAWFTHTFGASVPMTFRRNSAPLRSHRIRAAIGLLAAMHGGGSAFLVGGL